MVGNHQYLAHLGVPCLYYTSFLRSFLRYFSSGGIQKACTIPTFSSQLSPNLHFSLVFTQSSFLEMLALKTVASLEWFEKD